METFFQPLSVLAPSILKEGRPDTNQIYKLTDPFGEIEKAFKMLYLQQMFETIHWVFDHFPEIESLGLAIDYENFQRAEKRQILYNELRYDRSYFYQHNPNWYSFNQEGKTSCEWFEKRSKEDQEILRDCSEILTIPFSSETFKTKAVDDWRGFLITTPTPYQMQRSDLINLKNHLFPPEYQAQWEQSLLAKQTTSTPTVLKRPGSRL